MAASVHARKLGRWFEMLCRIEHHRLRAVASGEGTALHPGSLPAVGGVYCFWWTVLASPQDIRKTTTLSREGFRPYLPICCALFPR